MKKIIRGKKYNFYIVSEGNEFFIKAKCLLLKRYSFINNLNPILSEFGISGDDDKYYDSWWILSKNEVRKFEKIAKEILSDKLFRNYLEEKLDEDRECGEWENKK